MPVVSYKSTICSWSDGNGKEYVAPLWADYNKDYYVTDGGSWNPIGETTHSSSSVGQNWVDRLFFSADFVPCVSGILSFFITGNILMFPIVWIVMMGVLYVCGFFLSDMIKKCK